MDGILVLQTGGWIGDMVLLTPALRALKAVYPRSHLTLLVRPLVAELMATHPHVDDTIIDLKGQSNPLVAAVKLIGDIRRRDFELAVVLHPTSFRNALLPFLVGVPRRIGSNAGGRGILLTQSCPDRTDLHEVHRYLRILALIGIHDVSPHLEFWHTDADRQSVSQLLATHGIYGHHQLIGVNLGTTWPTKQWSIERFAATVQYLNSRSNAAVVLTGSPGEIPLGESLLRETDVEVVNLIGKTTLMQLGALIERCDVFLAGDSGPMHIAAAVGTKTVALFGPTSPSRHRPLGEGHIIIEKPVDCRPCYKRQCLRKDAPHLCMTEIQPIQVVEAVLQGLSE